jgi:hypothetical protein
MTGTPILMIPGLNATARTFAAEIDTLYQFGSVIIADHRGARACARSPRPSSPTPRRDLPEKETPTQFQSN